MTSYINHFPQERAPWQHDIELLFAMTEREIKARYKNALLGFLWIILNPLLQMVFIGGVFAFVFKQPVVDYFLYLFSGLLIWNYFSLSFLKTTPSIIFELQLIEKARFSREVIVLSIILSNLFHTIISLLLFIIFLFFLQKIIIWKLLILPLVLIWTTTLLAGLSLFTSALNVKFRDVNFFVQALVPLWFYATPIVYFANSLPPQLQLLLAFNPLSSIIQTYQWLLIDKPFPSWQGIAISLTMTIVITVLGIYVFRKEAPFFDDWV